MLSSLHTSGKGRGRGFLSVVAALLLLGCWLVVAVVAALLLRCRRCWSSLRMNGGVCPSVLPSYYVLSFPSYVCLSACLPVCLCDCPASLLLIVVVLVVLASAVS